MNTISNILNYIEENGLYPEMKTVSSSPRPVVDIESRKLIMFCTNNYLNLASHPKVLKAAIDAIKKYGTGAGGSATLTFTYADAEIPANGELYLAAQRYDKLIDKWQTALPSQVPDILNNRVSVPNTIGFGPFALALVSEPLPVELLDFDVQLNGKGQTDRHYRRGTRGQL